MSSSQQSGWPQGLNASQQTGQMQPQALSQANLATFNRLGTQNTQFDPQPLRNGAADLKFQMTPEYEQNAFGAQGSLAGLERFQKDPSCPTMYDRIQRRPANPN